MESMSNKKIQYKICSRCIMDTSSDPNLVLDENGEVLDKQHGLMMEAALVSLLNKLIDSENKK